MWDVSHCCADLPVRMALGEAHVVALTKKGLEEGGADVTALEQAALTSGKASTKAPGVDRSSTVLLVKNLPYSATETELLVSESRLHESFCTPTVSNFWGDRS